MAPTWFQGRQAETAWLARHLSDPGIRLVTVPAEMMLALLEAFPAGEPVVVLLDNLESVMDPERETLAESALHEVLSAVLTGPAHAITMIATTRVTPTVLLGVEPARQRRLLGIITAHDQDGLLTAIESGSGS